MNLVEIEESNYKLYKNHGRHYEQFQVWELCRIASKFPVGVKVYSESISYALVMSNISKMYYCSVCFLQLDMGSKQMKGWSSWLRYSSQCWELADLRSNMWNTSLVYLRVRCVVKTGNNLIPQCQRFQYLGAILQ